MNRPGDEIIAPSRTELRLGKYARDLRRAWTVSFVLHLVLATMVNPALLLGLLPTKVLIGYSGRPHRGDLAPEDEIGENRVALVRVRRFTGPLTLTSVSLAGTQERTPPSQEIKTPLKGNFVPQAPEEQNTRGGSGGTGGPLVFELGEDWTVLPGSGPLARTDRFQVLKIVRPHYPYAALKAGIEGMIKLEVRVDSTGKVAAVRAIENTAHDRTLEDAAVQAMFLWEFKPFLSGPKALPFTLLVPFRYRLTD
jgi:TonB family protein